MKNVKLKQWLSIILVFALLFSTFQLPFTHRPNSLEVMAETTETGNISERLLDNEAKPYVNVTSVIVNYSDETIVANAQSDSEGWVHVYDLKPGKYRMRVAAESISNGLQGEGWNLVEPSNSAEAPSTSEPDVAGEIGLQQNTVEGEQDLGLVQDGTTDDNDAANTVDENNSKNETESGTTENNSTENNSTENSSTENSSTENNSTESNSTESSSTESNSTENSSTESNSTENNSTESNSTESNSTENSSTEGIQSESQENKSTDSGSESTTEGDSLIELATTRTPLGSVSDSGTEVIFEEGSPYYEKTVSVEAKEITEADSQPTSSNGTLTIGNATLSAMLGYYKDNSALDFALDDGVVPPSPNNTFIMSKHLVLKFNIVRNTTRDPNEETPVFTKGEIRVWLPDIPGGTPSTKGEEVIFSKPIQEPQTGRWYIENMIDLGEATTVSYPVIYSMNMKLLQSMEQYRDSLTVLMDNLKTDIDVSHDGQTYSFNTVDQVSYQFTRKRSDFNISKYGVKKNNNDQITYGYQNITWPDSAAKDPEQEYKEKYYWGEWEYYLSTVTQYSYRYDTLGEAIDTLPLNGEAAQVRGTLSGTTQVVLWDVNKGWLPKWDSAKGVYVENPEATPEFVSKYISDNFYFNKLEILSGDYNAGQTNFHSDYKTVKVTYDNIEKAYIGSNKNSITILTRFEKTGYDKITSNKNVTNTVNLDLTYPDKVDGVNTKITKSSSNATLIKAIAKGAKPIVTYEISGGKSPSPSSYSKADLSEENQNFSFTLSPLIRTIRTLEGVKKTLTTLDKSEAYDVVLEDNAMQGTVGKTTSAFNNYVYTSASLYNPNGEADNTDYAIYVRYAGQSQFEPLPGADGSGTLDKIKRGIVAKQVDLSASGKNVAGVRIIYKDVYNEISSSMNAKLDGYFEKSSSVYGDLSSIVNTMTMSLYTDYDPMGTNNLPHVQGSYYCTITLYDRTYSAVLRTKSKPFSVITDSLGDDVITWIAQVSSHDSNTEAIEDLRNFTVIDVLPRGMRLKNGSYSVNGSNPAAAVKITKGTANATYEYPSVESVTIEQVTDEAGIVRDKVTARFVSDPKNKNQRMYRNSMSYDLTYDTYVSDHSLIPVPYVTNYTAVVLNDSNYEQGSDLCYSRGYSVYEPDNYNEGNGIFSKSENRFRLTAAKTALFRNDGAWKTTDAVDSAGQNMWVDKTGTKKEYVVWSYSSATLAYDISIFQQIDNSAYPSTYVDANHFKYDVESDLYRGRWRITLSQGPSTNPLYPRNFTFVDILPPDVKLANGQASVKVVPLGIRGYKMPDYRIIVDEDYKGTGRQRVMIIFTSDKDNKLQLFYPGNNLHIYLDTVLTEFGGGDGSKDVSNLAAILYKDFDIGQRGSDKSSYGRTTNNSGFANSKSETSLKFGRADSLFDNADELPGSSVYDDNGTNDAVKTSSCSARITRYLLETGNTYVEQVRTDIYNFKKGISQSHFGKPADIKMTVTSSGTPETKNTNIILYNFMPRVGDVYGSEYDWKFKSVSSAQGNPVVYYTTSEAVKGISGEAEATEYALKSTNGDIWKKYDDSMSVVEKAKITGIAMDFGDYVLPNNTAMYATVTVMMPDIDGKLIHKTAYNKFYTESDSVTNRTVIHVSPFPSNTIRLQLLPPNLLLGDTVFFDENDNGVMDGDEKGVDGITVNLYKIEGGQEVWKGSTISENGGKYSLNVSEQGDYRLKFAIPPKLGDTLPKFSDHISTFESTKDSPQVKKNIVSPDGWTETISYYYNNFEDFNGKTVCEYRNVSAGLTATYSLIMGDKVFLDENNNGVMDEKEAGLGGIAVDLYKEGGNSPIQSTTTDMSGNYRFVVNESGSYYVKVVIPESNKDTYRFYFQKFGSGDDNLIQRNSVDGSGKSDVIFFDAAGAQTNKKDQTESWLDAALTPTIKMNVTGKVFLDTNKDGVMNEDESGLLNIEVRLYRPARDGDVDVETVDGEKRVAVGKKYTDESGDYEFTVAEEDNYYVRVITPDTYDFSGLTAEPQSEDQHVNKLNIDGWSQPIPFKYESGKTNYGVDHVDGGLIETTGNLNITVIRTGSHDFDDGPIYLEGAEFKLLDENGETVKADIVTDSNGTVDIPDLPVGKYVLVETKSPEGYLLPDAPRWDVEIFKDDNTYKEIENDLLPPQTRIVSITVIETGTIENPEYLPGASFQLVDEDGKTYDVGKNIITGPDGNVLIEGLPYGNYTLVETVAPEGYILDEVPKKITVSEKSPNVIEIIVENGKKEFPPGTHHLLIENIEEGSEKNPVYLPAGVFNLLDSQGDIYKENIKTGIDGTVLVYDLPPGEYKLVQILPPEGYLLNSREFPITIPAEGTDIVKQVVENHPLANNGNLTNVGSGERKETEKPNGENTTPRNERPNGENTTPRNERPNGENTTPRNERPSGENTTPRNERPSGENTTPRNERPSGENTTPRNERPNGENTTPRNERPSGESVVPATVEKPNVTNVTPAPATEEKPNVASTAPAPAAVDSPDVANVTPAPAPSTTEKPNVADVVPDAGESPDTPAVEADNPTPAVPDNTPSEDAEITVTQNGHTYHLVFDDEMGMYYVLDEDGTPLGWIDIPDGESIDSIDILEDLIPLGTVKQNPKTGDMSGIAAGLIALTALGFVALVYTRRRLNNR